MTYQRFDDQASYRASLLEVLARAHQEVRILDRDFVSMGGDSRPFLDALHHYLAQPENPRLHIAVHDSSALLSHLTRARLLAQQHPLTLCVRQIPDDYRHLTDSHLLADNAHGVRRFHVAQARGALMLDAPDEVLPWWRRFEELWELSHPINLSSTAGL